MKTIILGAGIAGAVAYGALRGHSPIPVIFDAAPEKTAGLAQHKAIMRLRLPEIGLLLGSALDKVLIHKAVLMGGQLLNEPTITANNLYSIKAYGTIGDRSIGELGRVERWLMTDKPSIIAEYEHKLEDIQKQKAIFSTPQGNKSIDYKFAISTMPMPILLNITGLAKDFPIDFIHHPIHVLRITLSIRSTVNQTIYTPEPKYSTYRASLEYNTLIFEGVNEISLMEAAEIAIYFGVKSEWFQTENRSTQKIGKMLPIPEEARKAIIYRLTNEFNIFSFGRFAIWKPIRTDHLLNDIELIKRLMSSFEYGRKYDGKKVQG